MENSEINFFNKVFIAGKELTNEEKTEIERKNTNIHFHNKTGVEGDTVRTSPKSETKKEVEEIDTSPNSDALNLPSGSMIGNGGRITNINIESESVLPDSIRRDNKLDKNSIQSFFTENIPKGHFAYDFLTERCEKLLRTEGLNTDAKSTILDAFYHVMSESFDAPEKGIDIPDGLKEMLLKNPELLDKFLRFTPSYLVDMDDIASLTENLPLDEQKFIWHIFHKKFGSLSNRGLESFGFPKDTIEGIINEEILLFPEEPIVVLDAGCGSTGNAIRELKEKYKEKIIAVGVDTDIREASEGNIILKEADIRSMPFADNFFHLVYEVGVAGYLKRNEKGLENFVLEVLRILKKDGKLLMTDIHPDDLNFLEKRNLQYEQLPKTSYVTITKK
jgi:SAM-dependent methyltransferase